MPVLNVFTKKIKKPIIRLPAIGVPTSAISKKISSIFSFVYCVTLYHIYHFFSRSYVTKIKFCKVKKKEAKASSFYKMFCYIMFTRTSITASPPSLEPIALPIILPAGALLSAFACPLTLELTIKSPLATGPVTLQGTLPANAT